MKSLRHIFLCSIFFFNNAPIASEVDNSYQKQSLLAVLYKRTSAEYKANTFQVYSSAKNNIDKALQDKSWTALLNQDKDCLLYTSPSPRDVHLSRMPSSA